MKFLNNWTKEKFLKQIKKKNPNQQVVNFSNDCLYRDIDGACCLVGAFIPDNKYHPQMEGLTASDVIEKFNLKDDMPLSVYEMQKLQSIHDELEEHEDLYKKVENYLNGYFYS